MLKADLIVPLPIGCVGNSGPLRIGPYGNGP